MADKGGFNRKDGDEEEEEEVDQTVRRMTRREIACTFDIVPGLQERQRRRPVCHRNQQVDAHSITASKCKEDRERYSSIRCAEMRI